MDHKEMFETNAVILRAGKITGFIFSYALATTILYMILHTTEKIPATWTWWSIAVIMGIVVLSGIGLKTWMER